MPGAGGSGPYPGQGAVLCLVLRDARGRREVTAGGGQGGGDVRRGGD